MLKKTARPSRSSKLSVENEVSKLDAHSADQSNPLTTRPHEPLHLFWALFKAIVITLIFVCIFFFMTMGVVAWWGWLQLNTFTTAAGISPTMLYSTFSESLVSSPKQTDQRTTFLILGIDSLPTRGDSAPLTDTIILASINSSQNSLTTLSLPRDLWSTEYQTRINALYAYGTERDPTQPAAFPTQVLTELTGVPIHYTLVISLDQLAQFIDLIGGVEVTIPQGFTDTQFPRPDVDVTKISDPKLLYQTVSFSEGKQTLNGERALQYIRSRHSASEEGNDNARSARQQLVIKSMLSQLLSEKILTNPKLLGSLYKYYATNFENQLPLTEMLSLARVLFLNEEQLSFSSSQLPIYPETSTANVYHPPLNQYQGQWVYAIRDQASFKTEVQSLLTSISSNSATLQQ